MTGPTRSVAGRSHSASPKGPSATPISSLPARRPQAALRVSQPSDPYEREADRVADRVMGMTASSTVMRACACDDDEVSRSAQPSGPSGVAAGGFTVGRSDVAPSGSGRSLDPSTRSWAEGAFGRDFSDVRVHTGAGDARAAAEVGARAYTLGPNIVFGPGQYRPGTEAGRRLLAHELTHVVQQRGGAEPETLHRAEVEPKTDHATPGPLRAPLLGPLAKTIAGTGRPLSLGERSVLEPALGHDLADVTVHTGPRAHRSAEAMNARAFAVGTHIVLGRDVDRSASLALEVLAHEATHVVQQAGGSVGPNVPSGISRANTAVAKLDPSDCATDCTTPAGNDGPTGHYRLVVYADKESFGPFVLQAATSKVGHSWLKLVDPSGSYWYYGFWPQEGFDASSPFDDVAGCVWTDEDQGGHEPSSQLEFTLTEEQFIAARDLAQATCTDRPDYNLFGLQCTEFVYRVMEAAGVGPAGGFGLIIESPNALDAMLEEDQLLVGLNIRAAGTNTYTAGRVSLDVEGRSQLAATLGNRLRLFAMGQGELGSGMGYLGAGLGTSLRVRTPYLPSLVVSGGIAGGDTTPGRLGDKLSLAATGSAGLEFRLDEILAIGAEYNVLADIARQDPVVQRFLISLRVPF